MPRALWWSLGGGGVCYKRGTPVHHSLACKSSAASERDRPPCVTELPVFDDPLKTPHNLVSLCAHSLNTHTALGVVSHDLVVG
jgi:hypothetical protein